MSSESDGPPIPGLALFPDGSLGRYRLARQLRSTKYDAEKMHAAVAQGTVGAYVHKVISECCLGG